MAKITTFRDLLIWKKSHQLTLKTYDLVKSFPRFEEFGLASQMRRSSSSVPTNIAEGFKRRSKKDSCHFYNLSESSLEELKYQLILAKDLRYVTLAEYGKLNDLAEEISKLLYGWIKTQK
jgi:four helix bundle protein